MAWRPMRGWLFVGPATDFEEERSEGWVQRCLTLKPG